LTGWLVQGTHGNVQNTALLSEPESKDPDTRRLKKLVASIIPSPSGEIGTHIHPERGAA
jgi:hypothetical protein